MHFITELIVSALVAYVSFTNGVADRLAFLLTPTPDIAETVAVTETKLSVLPSLFDFQGIPSILRQSAEFQQAAVVGSTVASTYVTDPLDAIVNIYCTFVTDTTIRTTTGTGFFVHSEGVILTNAHVAQYLLLGHSDLLGKADCIIRQGNPAVPKYKAELLYIPPAWIQTNAAVIDAAVPTGTGERDYALLYVTESLTNEPLPARFPALAVNSNLMGMGDKGRAVVAAGFPATDLVKNGASTALIPRRADAQITDLFTFGSNRADVFSISGSIVGAEGSSGGPVVDSDGKAVGIIVTRGDDTKDGAGSLRAITLSHVARTIEEETGFNLEKNLTGDLPLRSNVFMETLAPFLIRLLSFELNN